MRSKHLLLAVVLTGSALALAQNTPAPTAPPPPNSPENVAGIPVNYDQSKVGEYALPDALTLNNGKPVRDANTMVEDAPA